jgi:prolyl-tRNA editing enzyme YbaK/EbsC (Cys-tRNA(Pro) deacylase)
MQRVGREIKIRLTDRQIEHVDATAELLGVSRSACIRTLCCIALAGAVAGGAR